MERETDQQKSDVKILIWLNDRTCLGAFLCFSSDRAYVTYATSKDVITTCVYLLILSIYICRRTGRVGFQMASKPSLAPWGNALTGATGAVLANAIVYPLDV